MSLVKIDWRPDRQTLKEFSQWWLFFVGMVAAPMAYFRGQEAGSWPIWESAAYGLWCLAVLGRLAGIFRPDWLRPVYVALMFVTFPIGWLVSHLALGILYYGVITPVGLVFRLLGRDPMTRRLDPKADTYWEPHRPDQGLARYLRQF